MKAYATFIVAASLLITPQIFCVKAKKRPPAPQTVAVRVMEPLTLPHQHRSSCSLLIPISTLFPSLVEEHCPRIRIFRKPNTSHQCTVGGKNVSDTLPPSPTRRFDSPQATTFQPWCIHGAALVTSLLLHARSQPNAPEVCPLLRSALHYCNRDVPSHEDYIVVCRLIEQVTQKMDFSEKPYASTIHQVFPSATDKEQISEREKSALLVSLFGTEHTQPFEPPLSHTDEHSRAEPLALAQASSLPHNADFDWSLAWVGMDMFGDLPPGAPPDLLEPTIGDFLS